MGQHLSYTYHTERTLAHTHILRDRPALWNVSISFKMSGIAAKLQHHREKAQGIGSNDHAVKYLNQDFEALRRSCLERGQLFQDECFEPLPSSLGFDELGPNSPKVRGISWKRPSVGTGGRWKHLLGLKGFKEFTYQKNTVHVYFMED